MIVGIDVAKATIVAVVIDRSTRIRETVTVENTAKALDAFVKRIQNQYKKVEFASESTAEYHRELMQICLFRHIPFRLLNPIVTKQYIRSTIRKKKTDTTDAQIIAKLALYKEGALVKPDALLLQKPEIRTAIKLSDLKRRFTLMQRRANRLGIDTTLIDKLQECQKVIREAQKAYEAHVAVKQDTKLTELLESIPGVGPHTASVLIAEIVTIENFPTGKSLAAFFGLDPKVRQSGKTLHHNTKITKRGSKCMRKTLFNATNVARRYDKELKAYYTRKRSEGRMHKEAIVATARKLLYRVFAVWKRQTPYVLS